MACEHSFRQFKSAITYRWDWKSLRFRKGFILTTIPKVSVLEWDEVANEYNPKGLMRSEEWVWL